MPGILITGGAGFLGINLCRHLLGRGYALRSMDIAPFLHAEAGQLDVRQADIRDANAVATALEGVHTVIHCAAALPRSSARDIDSTNVTGTTLLLEGAERSGVERFIFISSTAVYGIPRHHPILETDALSGVGPYGSSKIEAEQACLRQRHRSKSGLCVSILRPKTFVGPERLGAFELLYRWAYEGRNFPVIGRGDNQYQLLDVADLCEIIERCCALPVEQVNDTFNVGAAEFGTMRQNFQAVLDRAGHGAHVVALPAGPSIAALRLLQWLHLSPLYPWIYETAAHDSVVSIERLTHRFAYVPRYSNEAALVRNYEWYLEHRSRFEGRTGTTHTVPWSSGALGLARHFF